VLLDEPGVNYAFTLMETPTIGGYHGQPSLDIYCDLTLVAWIKPESVPPFMPRSLDGPPTASE